MAAGGRQASVGCRSPHGPVGGCRSPIVRWIARYSLSILLAACARPALAELSAHEAQVHAGIDLELADRTFAEVRNATLVDHQGHKLGDIPEMEPLFTRCQHAYKRAVWEERRGLPPHLFVDELAGVQLGDRSLPTDPRIVYFIGVSRESGAVMVSRLLLALYHSSHLFLVHIDLKTDNVIREQLANLTEQHPNIKLLKTRRLVQWGAWTMVAVMLDALKTVTRAALDYDFFINLSDADIALRTNDEILSFLRPYKGRQFVQVHTGTGEWLEKAANFTAAHTVVECGGYGYVGVNSSLIDFGGNETPCCFGRGGHVLYANSTDLHLLEAREAQAQHDANITRLFTGSQWVILDRMFCAYLVNDERSLRWQRVFQRRFLPDEAFVQTVLMHSPYNGTLINANMRHIYWPHYDGDPTHYWRRMGWSFIGGPQVINASQAPAVFQSPYMFARKVDPSVDAETVRLWDEWMGKKLKGWTPPDQELLGGASTSATLPPLERSAAPKSTAEPVNPLPTRILPAGRRVQQVHFEDGSTCDCDSRCSERSSCCDDWEELCRRASMIAVSRSPCASSLAAMRGATSLLCVPMVPPERGLSLERRLVFAILRMGVSADAEPTPPCAVPANPPLASARWTGRSIKLTFLNHAPYPLKVYYVSESSEEVPMGSLDADGHALTFESSDSHAWVVRSWGGVTVLEVQPLHGRAARTTVDIYECNLSSAARRLHYGWK